MKKLEKNLTKKIRDLGFPVTIISSEDLGKLDPAPEGYWTGMASCALCPSLPEVQEWLRTSKNLLVYVTPIYSDNLKIKYIHTILSLPLGGHESLSDIYETWDDALEEGLKKAIELIEGGS